MKDDTVPIFVTTGTQVQALTFREVFQLFSGNFREFTASTMKKYGRIWQLRLGSKRTIIGTDAEFAKRVVTEPDIYQRVPEFLPTRFGRMWMGTAISFVNGETWKRHKKAMNSAFHFDAMRKYFHNFNEISISLVEHLRAQGPGPVDIKSWVNKATLDIMGTALFGHHFHAMDGHLDEFIPLYHYYSSEVRNVTYILFPFLEYLPTPRNRRMLDTLRRMDDILLGIADKIEREKRTDCCLGMVMAAKADEHFVSSTGSGLTPKEIRDNIQTLYLAGHDTTSSTVSWALYHLVNNPDLLQKALKETDDKWPQGEALSFEHVQAMDYLGMVIKETLRVSPPVSGHLIRRVAKADVLCGVRVSPGTDVISLILPVHSDPSVWPEPERFDPERFSPENSAKQDPYAFLGFSQGPRRCIGMQFATIEAKVLLSHLLRSFSFSLPEGFKVEEVSFMTEIMKPLALPMVLKQRAAGAATP